MKFWVYLKFSDIPHVFTAELVACASVLNLVKETNDSSMVTLPARYSYLVTYYILVIIISSSANNHIYWPQINQPFAVLPACLHSVMFLINFPNI